MRTALSATILLVSLGAATPAAAQVLEPRIPAVGVGANAAAFGSNARDAGGVGLGAAVSLLAKRQGWPGLVRAEVTHFEFAGFGRDCPTVPGGGCGSGGVSTLSGATLGMVTPLRSRTRFMASAMVGTFVNRSGGVTSVDAALGVGFGLGSLAREGAGTVELRALWLAGRHGQSLVLPFSVTIYR